MRMLCSVLFAAAALAAFGTTSAAADGGTDVKAQPPILELSLHLSESSKDSNHQRFEIRITDDELRYSGPLGEGTRGQYEHGERTAKLPAAQRDELLKRLRRAWTTTYEEKKSAEGHGHFADLTGRLLVSREGAAPEPVTVRVVGRISKWGPEDRPRLEQEGRRLVNAAEGLAWAAKELVEK